ncbi:hypothetical protein QVD17_18066 [Tagetes erecta]|uniref:TCP domain-containing protein n=1 Tax=Tagetes erecta TaxID=13708 RepID=A0AAD8KH33_TARER|nr:hypothetical protein QVD17_18066 [Tagetes erecta]
MEVDEVDEVVDEIQTQVINKIQKIRANSSNPNYSFPVVTDDCSGRWPSSRIVRVSRASGGKDRHSKVVTSKGLRDRRIRLSVSTAIEFYDLQDRLGFDQPSKAVEWLINAASSSISELPSLDPPLNHQFSGRNNQMGNDNNNNSNSNSNSNNNNGVVSKVSACSSTSETSKGSGHSRTENRIRARERARDRRKSPFTDLLTGGAVSPMDYFQPSVYG